MWRSNLIGSPATSSGLRSLRCVFSFLTQWSWRSSFCTCTFPDVNWRQWEKKITRKKVQVTDISNVWDRAKFPAFKYGTNFFFSCWFRPGSLFMTQKNKTPSALSKETRNSICWVYQGRGTFRCSECGAEVCQPIGAVLERSLSERQQLVLYAGRSVTSPDCTLCREGPAMSPKVWWVSYNRETSGTLR